MFNYFVRTPSKEKYSVGMPRCHILNFLGSSNNLKRMGSFSSNDLNARALRSFCFKIGMNLKMRTFKDILCTFLAIFVVNIRNVCFGYKKPLIDSHH